MEIIQPQRYALWSEQIVIVALASTCHRRIKVCSMIQQVERRCISRINTQPQAMEALQICLPWQAPQPVKSDGPGGLHSSAATFPQAYQYPANPEFETRLK